MNNEKRVVKAKEAAERGAKDLHVEVLNRNRVACSLRTVARLVRLGLEELAAAQTLAGREIGDERLMSQILNYQNRLTLAELDMPDLGAMEQQIEQLRMNAFTFPAVCPPLHESNAARPT